MGKTNHSRLGLLTLGKALGDSQNLRGTARSVATENGGGGREKEVGAFVLLQKPFLFVESKKFYRVFAHAECRCYIN